MNIAINGFGRIGRTFLRVLFEDRKRTESIRVKAINIGTIDIASVAYLFQYDTTMLRWRGAPVRQEGNELVIGDERIMLIAEADATRLPWKTLEIDWVVDCSGRYTHAVDARQHLQAGSKQVLVSAPMHDPDVTIIPGLNERAFQRGKHSIVSLGSCTTNALFPLLGVLDRTWGIDEAAVLTVHAYTNSQSLLDSGPKPGKDYRGYRAAALNIIPHSSGSAALVAVLFPHLKERVTVQAMRVPVPDVSLLQVTFVPKKSVDAVRFNEELVRAIAEVKQFVTVTTEPLVSSDFIGNPASVVIDLPLTSSTGRSVTVYGWYDNEWGYCCRLRDFLSLQSVA